MKRALILGLFWFPLIASSQDTKPTHSPGLGLHYEWKQEQELLPYPFASFGGVINPQTGPKAKTEKVEKSISIKGGLSYSYGRRGVFNKSKVFYSEVGDEVSWDSKYIQRNHLAETIRRTSFYPGSSFQLVFLFRKKGRKPFFKTYLHFQESQESYQVKCTVLDHSDHSPYSDINPDEYKETNLFHRKTWILAWGIGSEFRWGNQIKGFLSPSMEILALRAKSRIENATKPKALGYNPFMFNLGIALETGVKIPVNSGFITLSIELREGLVAPTFGYNRVILTPASTSLMMGYELPLKL